MRYAGIKNNKICVISNDPIEIKDLQVLEVPIELANIPSLELIATCKVKNGSIISKLLKKTAKKMKVALVGNWKQQCGISTYFENLVPPLVKQLGDFKLFIERNDFLTGNVYQVGDQLVNESQVSFCWKRGESLLELANQIKEYDPDLIIIQHEYGLWSNARYWLSLMTSLSDYRVITVMHSVFPHHHDKTVYEASMKEIIVHLPDAKKNLQEDKKLNSVVHVIPHGCYAISDQKKLWNNYKSDHNFIQQGFGFRYKGFESSIKATVVLKTKYPDVFFTGLFSESPQNTYAHQAYYNELMDLVQELGLQENVSIIRGFQSDNVVNSYLRSNQVAVFPYASVPGHEVFGSSGAARLAMSVGIPVISSSIPHFSDLPTVKADTAEQIAEALDSFFCDANGRKLQVEKQNKFITENSWENIAKQYINIFES